jgi:hypothetical protein
MEAEDPLSQLRDIHLPEAVTFWPPAPGWWVVLVLLLIGLAFVYRQAIIAMIQRRKLTNVLAQLHEAHVCFTALAQDAEKRNQAGLDFLATVNILLNRVVMVKYPDAPSEKLSGNSWLAFLDSFDNTTDFTQGAGTPLAEGIYRRTFDADVDALLTLVTTWIERRYQEKKPASHLFPAKVEPGA